VFGIVCAEVRDQVAVGVSLGHAIEDRTITPQSCALWCQMAGSETI
jgi:hypothetical protein